MRRTVLSIIIMLTVVFITSFANAAPVITLSADKFSPGESIIIKIKNLPGNPKDWLTLVKVDAPASKFGEWSYTKGVTEGTWTFSAPKRPGDYEVRVFFDYPAGGETIHARAAVKVIAKKKSQPQITVQAVKPESKTAPSMTLEQSQNLDANKKLWEQKLQRMQGNKIKSDQTTNQKQIKQSQQNQSASSSSTATSAAIHQTNPTTDFILTSFDKIWIPAKGKSIGKAKDVFQRLSAIGYIKSDTNWIAIATVNNSEVIIAANCGNGQQCEPDGVITLFTLTMKMDREAKSYFPDLATKSVSHFRNRIGKESSCRAATKTRAECQWASSGAANYHRKVGLKVRSIYPSAGASIKFGIIDSR